MKKKSAAIFLLVVIYVTFIALGLPDALLGSAWTMIRLDLGATLETLGVMTVVVYVMSILSTLGAPRLLRAFPTRWIIFVSVLSTGTALLLLSRVTAFYQMLFFALPLGAGAGAIDVALNHYLASHYEAKHMSYLHSFYGIGVTLGPTVMAYALAAASWRTGYVVVGSLLLAIALLILVSFPFWKKDGREDREELHAPVTTAAVLHTKGALASILVFLLYVHLESLGGVWVASYFHIALGVAPAIAALAATTFYLALTAGRVLSGVLTRRLDPLTLVRIGEATILGAAVALMLLRFDGPFAFVAVFLLGLGAGPVYPNMMFLNSRVFPRRSLGKIISLQMAIGYLGFGLLTPLAGLFFGKVSIVWYPLVLGIVSTLLLLTTRQYRLRTRTMPPAQD